ncbi:nucleoside recognition domain-containing protein [Methermicoccus shengliensis]|uniref:Nucleoside recognition protein n=1 Tax=Methermicoccus shengliensis TaxID=660064 RepID=A0A832RZF9_9EURY|nr:nucleoside recognition domain-containing protein [Methermicoccus shengliensis]KUK04596.1 MAG: Nucleoside recognition domain protein [Euryarchaeota archaeon 55_53]KUK29984.1 MAG: Nucleoside recognition domain protein [Methanosarcinales archeaon 56_1174]MDI3488466.1 hypothetical protein [Methanosarcinales archaeon]MDN5294924.1 hypothetical protein [Methanosarcinales archaeon]HIH70116.1 nucleoside recognition protein [Methermicoccus shengliensis]
MLELAVEALVQTAVFLARVVPFMAGGIFLMEVLVELGWIDRMARLTLPLTRAAHLCDEVGVSFLTAFGSPSAANAILRRMYDGGHIDEREMMVGAVMNSFPSVVTHWRTMIPVLIPLLGWHGLVLILLLTIAGLMKTSIIMLYGRLTLVGRGRCTPPSSSQRRSLDGREAAGVALARTISALRRILKLMVPISILVFFLIGAGIFNMLSESLHFVQPYLPIPNEGLPIVATQLASQFGAYIIAGGLLDNGVLTGEEVVLTLLVGKVLTVVGILRTYMPYYLGIFGPAQGMKILLVSMGLRALTLTLVAGVYYVLAF